MLHISLSIKKDNADYKNYSIKITASSRGSLIYLPNYLTKV